MDGLGLRPRGPSGTGSTRTVQFPEASKPQPDEFMGYPLSDRLRSSCSTTSKPGVRRNQKPPASDQSAADVIEKLRGIEQVLFGDGSRRRDNGQIRHGYLLSELELNYQPCLWLACPGRLEPNQQLPGYPPAVLDVNALGLSPLPNF